MPRGCPASAQVITVNGADQYRFLTKDEAFTWLICAEASDDTIGRLTGSLPPEESGPALSPGSEYVSIPAGSSCPNRGGRVNLGDQRLRLAV